MSSLVLDFLDLLLRDLFRWLLDELVSFAGGGIELLLDTLSGVLMIG